MKTTSAFSADLHCAGILLLLLALAFSTLFGVRPRPRTQPLPSAPRAAQQPQLLARY